MTTDDAESAKACVLFLDSVVGRTIIERLGRLTTLEAVVRKTTGASSTESLEDLARRLENGRKETP